VRQERETVKRLQFGIGHDFRNMDPSRSTFAEVYARSIDRVVQAEALGYDYMFIGEHHLTEDGHAPSLFPIFGAIAARTERIRLNTYVFLLPLHHPLNVAEDVTAVDLLSNGRMELGVGLGYRSEEFTAFGIDRSQRGRIMDESCEILIKAWSESGWSYDGRHFKLDDIDVVPKPVQSPHPKLWVSARNERAARRAARLKRPLMIAPSPYTEDASVVYSAYADALREAGEDPAEYDVMGSYTVQVLDPGEQVVEPKGADSRLQQYIDWYAQDGDLPDEAGRIANPSDRLRRQIGVTGDAAACIAGIEELLEQVPFTLLMVGGISIKQMTRFSEQVAPHFRD